jgi:uncharacterized protein (DUF779 family)
MFIQSGGCCAGSIDGCPFYIDRRLDEAWHQDQFILDVAAGEPEDFSLAAGDNLHFVTHSPACAAPNPALAPRQPE